MGVFAFTDGVVVLNSVDLSDHVKSLTLSWGAEELETTAMGVGARTRIGGLKDGSLEIEFNQDFAAAEIDATIFPLIGTVVTFAAKATSEATSATNPEYSGSILVSQYTPLAGGVGEVASTSVTWPTSGDLTRATA